MLEAADSDPRIPTGAEANDPLAIAARAGFGPLSPRARQTWHGDGLPCVSCAQLNHRDSASCAHCGQGLNSDMLERMARHSGAWFVHDTVRPFPGVSLERILRQIKRGVLVRTSIVRGPTTYYQWRFAAETPLIARYLGLCWKCQSVVQIQERYCPKCKAVLDGHYRPGDERGADDASSAELADLGRAVEDSGMDTNLAHLARGRDRGLGRAPLIFLIIAVLAIGAVLTLASVTQCDVRPTSESKQTGESN